MDSRYCGILAVLIFPVVSGILGFCIGKSNKKWRNRWINIAMVVELGLLGCMMFQVLANGRVLRLTLWQFSFVLDAMRSLLCGLVTVVFAIMFWFMKESLAKEASSNRFYLLYMVVYTMILGAFMTDSLMNFTFFTLLAFLFIYPLIIHRQDDNEVKNARIYLFFLIISAIFGLTGCGLLYYYFDSTSYDMLYKAATLGAFFGKPLVAAILVFVAFAIFSGIFPLQSMITRGSSYGLMEASAILAGVVSKLGLIGLMVLAANVFPHRLLYGRILLAMGLLTIGWGIVISLSSTDIRKIIMGLNIATNGFNALAISLMVLSGDSDGYAARSSVYMMFASSLSLLALYMVALEQIRKMRTFEIKGLISSGRENKIMAVVCFLACASIAGVPGTSGFLSHALMYKTILTTLRWKWLVVLYIILWAFLAVAVTRIFMKLFVSEREKTLRLLTEEGEAVNIQKEEADEQLIEGDKTKKNPYQVGEILLLLLGFLQVVMGVLPHSFFDKMAGAIVEYSNGENLLDVIAYYTWDVMLAVAVVAALAALLYLNLIHGILLRAVRNKKNRELQQKM
jgi:hydrogenase-4 component B